MGSFEAVDKRVREKMRKQVLDQVRDTLLRCKQPFGCDPSCPYYKEAAAFDHPMVYCMPIMAGSLDYVRGTLEDEA